MAIEPSGLKPIKLMFDYYNPIPHSYAPPKKPCFWGKNTPHGAYCMRLLHFGKHQSKNQRWKLGIPRFSDISQIFLDPLLGSDNIQPPAPSGEAFAAAPVVSQSNLYVLGFFRNPRETCIGVCYLPLPTSYSCVTYYSPHALMALANEATKTDLFSFLRAIT